MYTNSLFSGLLQHPGFPLILEILAKSTLILLSTLVITYLLRTRAASIRHAIWSMAFVALIALPFVSLYGPVLHVPLNLGSGTVGSEAPQGKHVFVYSPAPEPNPSVVRPIPPAPESVRENGVVTPPFALPPADRAAAAEPGVTTLIMRVPWPTVLFLTWLAGFLFILFKSLIGFAAVRWLARRARPVTDPRLHSKVMQYRRAFGISRPVRLVRSMYAIMPMTWGAARPVVMIPADANEWTGERLRVVLLHELAHVKRFDWLIQTVAQFATAMYWFNPLVWKAEAELRRERELACDEAVLDAGARASDYANHLLEIARNGSVPRYAPQAALAMARRSRLEQRIRAILNPERQCASRVMNAVVILLGTVIALPLLAMRPGHDGGHPRSQSSMEDVRSFVEMRSTPPAAGTEGLSVAALGVPEPASALSEEDTFHWQRIMTAGQTIEIKGMNGGISAQRAAGREVIVDAVKHGRRSDPHSVRIVTVEHANGVTICAVYPGERNECLPGSAGRNEGSDNDVKVDFTVQVPPGVHFAGHTVNGPISASDLMSRVEANTVNGPVTVSSSHAVSAKTVNGPINVAVRSSEISETLEISTVNGPITVEVPAGVHVDVSAMTVNGPIRSDFESISVRRGRYGSQQSAAGKIGRGGALLSAATVNGSITIKRGMSSSSAPGSDVFGTRSTDAQVSPVPEPPQYDGDYSMSAPGSPSLAYATDEEDDLRSELRMLVRELKSVDSGIAHADSCDQEDQRRCVEQRRAKLEAEIEARAERLAAKVETRMAELEPLIEERALRMAEEVAIPTLDWLEQELPGLLDRLEAEIPMLIDEVMESLSRAFRDRETRE